MNILQDALEARKRSIENAMAVRKERKQDFSDWRFTSDDELKGRLTEINNTLTMMRAYKLI